LDEFETSAVSGEPEIVWMSGTSGAAADARSVLAGFVARLLERYQALAQDGGAFRLDEGVVEQRLTSLQLAEAAVRHAERDPSQRPAQIAVLGPTQTGKSTVVNLLLGRQVAQVSPLAGFTVHACGYGVGSATDGEWTDTLFPGWTRCEPAQMSREQLQAYGLTRVGDGPPELAAATGAVIWDTPDFDSLAARAYRRGVLEVAALADVHLLVLSKEKYSDLSVWNVVDLLRPLNRPLAICLNKLTPDAEEVVCRSLRERLRGRGLSDDVPVARLPYAPEIARGAGETASAEVAHLRRRLRGLTTAVDRRRRVAGVRALLERHWSAWIEPVVAEHAALDEWDVQIDQAVAEALTSYRRDYLDHPRRFDSFQRAIVEVLRLLEVPGVAGTLGRARRLLTWPARKLYAARVRWSERRREPAERAAGNEQLVLFDALERVLTRLARDVSRRAVGSRSAAPGVWRALGDVLEQQEERLREEFLDAVRHHCRAYEREIEAAANRIYERLEEHPSLLNTLRAARVTADAAAVALAIKTAGMGAHALLLAPPLLALTSMLTEGALGTYMKGVAAELKRKQLAAVEREVFGECVVPRLRSLGRDLSWQGGFGISPDQLRAARSALDRWGVSDDG